MTKEKNYLPSSIKEIKTKTLAEIVLIIFGFVFIHEINFCASSA